MSDQDAGGDAEAHRRIAARCNNAAWDLVETAELDAGGLARLVTAAATARHHWHAAGSPGEIAHADLLFGWALARAGAGKAAVHAAAAALAHFEANAAPPWELAFAHAAMAAACLADGDEAGYRRHHDRAAEFGAQLSGDDAKYFQAAFRTVPPAKDA